MPGKKQLLRFQFLFPKLLKPIPEQVKKLYDLAPRHDQRNFRVWQEAVEKIDAAPRGTKLATARRYGRRLGVATKTVLSKRSYARKQGPAALLDKRGNPQLWCSRPATLLPAATVEYIRELARAKNCGQSKTAAALRAQLLKWRAGNPLAAIPGYAIPPAGNPPAGWSAGNLGRYLPPIKRPPRLVQEVVVRIFSNGKTETVWRRFPK